MVARLTDEEIQRRVDSLNNRFIPREEYPETLKNISDMDLILSYQLGYIWS
jgi:ADP-dependent phosphofructokinase/glucokinase